MRVGAVVLAAGRSRRMGAPKALLPCHGRTFLRSILDALEQAGISEVRVVLGDQADEIRAAGRLSEDAIVVNPRPDDGMLSSLRCGIRALGPDLEGFLLWPVDHPLVLPRTVTSLVEALAAGRGGILVPVHDGRRGHPVLFAGRLAPLLLQAPDGVGARAVLRDHPQEVVEIPVADPGVVTDIDTPEEYGKALRRGPGKDQD